jgi:adenylate cyclase
LDELLAYIPIDRRHAMVRGEDLPGQAHGAVLSADISGFTPLTEALVQELGPRRGADELTRQLNRVYDALIAEVHDYGGSVIGFGGDAIICWFAGDSGLQATACGLAMQRAMQRFTAVRIPSSGTVTLGMKVAVASGALRRFRVGDPQVQYIDLLAGSTLDRLATGEHLAERGDILVSPEVVARTGDEVEVGEWRKDDAVDTRYGVVTQLADHAQVQHKPWADLSTDSLSSAQLRPWLLPAVYERLEGGRGQFLAEIRPAVALFLRFEGLDYDGDGAVGAKLDAYVQWVQKVLARYEGVLGYLATGDKGSHLYAAFGAPVAHEDDASRAVSAALQLLAPPADLDFITGVRIGISQGRMRTGAYGGTMRRTYGVLGDDVNLAARLMQAALPGHTLVSSRVRRATGESFSWQALPAVSVKGKAEPLPVFSLIGARERRASTLHRSSYTLPLIGREAELALIDQKLTLARQGQGQLLGITGEAGVGKSRLLGEAIRRAGDGQFAIYAGECESYGTNTSYLVWWSVWRAFFGIDSSWEDADQVAVLERELRLIDPALLARLPLLGAVLNLSIPDSELTRSFDAKLRKASLEALLVDCLRARASETPVLLVLEDCHWMDPLSHDLSEVIGRAAVGLRVLLLATYRPPDLERLQAPRVSGLPRASEIELTGLGPSEAERLIALKLGELFGAQREVPATLVERVTTRAQGNPFYVEELLSYLHDRGIDPQDTVALEQLDLPASLDTLVLSRLDQLAGSQGTTVRVASVVGRLFRAALLWGMYPELGEPDYVKADLEALCRQNLMLLDTPEPDLAFLFRHILTQEVAYQSLPYATRAMLHEQLAQFVERTFEEPLGQYVDMLAFHYERSENDDKKREYLLKAGEAAQAAYANEAAMGYYQRLLPFLAPEERVEVMLKLGEVLQLMGRWDEVHNICRESMTLAEESGDPQLVARCHTSRGELLWRRSQYSDAWASLERARVAYEEMGDQAGVGHVWQCEGRLAAVRGDPETARMLWERSLGVWRSLGDKARIADMLNNLGLVARNLGDLGQSRALHEQALAIRRDLEVRTAVAQSLNNLGMVLTDLGEYHAARSQLEIAVELQREIGDRWELANALETLATTARDQGDLAASHALYDESLGILWELGERWMLAYVLEAMGGLAALQGSPERALRLAGAAATLREATGSSLTATEQSILEAMLYPTREALGEAAASAAYREGQGMSLEQAVDYARLHAE